MIINHKRSRNRGAALVEGVIALSMIIGGTVLAVLLLVNVGMSVYYKQKLAVVSNYTAQYAASHQNSLTLQADSQREAQAFGTSMGIPNVQVDDIDFQTNPNFVTVKLSLQGNLMGQGDILPATISIKDTCSAPLSSGPWGFYWFRITAGSNKNTLGWVPLYKKPTSGSPVWEFTINTNASYSSAMDNAGPGPGPSTFKQDAVAP